MVTQTLGNENSGVISHSSTIIHIFDDNELDI